jgi:hypothetical protein
MIDSGSNVNISAVPDLTWSQHKEWERIDDLSDEVEFDRLIF